MIFLEVWERIKKETEIKTLTHLAEFLGSTQPYISRKKSQNNFPVEWAFKIAQEYDLLTEWIMTGGGPKRLESQQAGNYFFELEKWGKEISKSDNLEWMTQQIDQTFPMFKEWRKRKEESENNKSEIPDSKIA